MKLVLAISALIVAGCKTSTKSSEQVISTPGGQIEKIRFDQTTVKDILKLDTGLSIEERIEYILNDDKYKIWVNYDGSQKNLIRIAIKDRKSTKYTAHIFTVTVTPDGFVQDCCDQGMPQSHTG